MNKIFFCTLSLLLTSACTSTQVRSPAMLGGTEMQHASEVFFGSCSGTMITPHIVLTAGHCLQGFDRFNEQGKISVFYPPNSEILIQSFDSENRQQPRRTFILKVAKTVVHPTWSEALKNSGGSADVAADSNNVNDVGVMILDQNLPVRPASLPSIGVWDRPLEDFMGLLVFGAGCTQRGADWTVGKLKGALYQKIRRYPNKIEIAPYDALTKAPAGPCKKDSGGGAFMLTKSQLDPNQTSVIGVASIMSGSAAAASEEAPTGLFLARIDKKEVIDWLNNFLKLPSPAVTASNLEK